MGWSLCVAVQVALLAHSSCAWAQAASAQPSVAPREQTPSDSASATSASASGAAEQPPQAKPEASSPEATETEAGTVPTAPQAEDSSITSSREVTSTLTPQGCLPIHERSQELTLEGRLRAARDALRQCSDDICPAMVRADCRSWLAETERGIPTLVFQLQADVAPQEVRLLINGQPAPAVFGQPVAFDPGSVQLTFIHNKQQVVLNLILRQGEKNRVQPVEFAQPEVAHEAPPPVVPPVSKPPLAPPLEAPSYDHSSRQTATYILGGVALAGVASATYFGVRGLQDARDAQRRCSPLCPKSESSRIRQTLIFADVSGGVALLSATLAIALWAFDSDEGSGKTALARSFNVVQRPGGLQAVYRGEF